MPPEKLWKTASSYLRGICHKERDSLQFLSGEKKITSWTNARSCTYQGGKWTIAAHWMIRCADFSCGPLPQNPDLPQKQSIHTRLQHRITLNSAAGALHWENTRKGNLHTCAVCCRNKMPVLLRRQAQNEARLWNLNLSLQLLLQMSCVRFIPPLTLSGIF